MQTKRFIAALTIAVSSTLILTPRCAADENTGLAAKVNPALPTIPDKTFTLTDYGAIPDGKTLNTDAFHKAIAAVKDAGGGTLLIPKGTWRTLPFELCSNLNLHLDAGAVIQAPDTFAEYGMPEPKTLHSQDEVRDKVPRPAPFITAQHVHDLAITGDGTIDGSGSIWWPWTHRATPQRPNDLLYPRQRLVEITNCQRLHVQGVTFKNSPVFHFVPINVTDLVIENAKFSAPAKAPNTDAVDPYDCNNVLIRDCDFDVGDDDISIKNGGKHFLIENCRVLHGHGISIGSLTTNGISDVLVRHCSFDGADNGVRIKSMRGSGGLVHDIHYTDITMKNMRDAIVLDMTYSTSGGKAPATGQTSAIPVVRDVLIDNITVDSAKIAGKIVGIEESPFSNILIKNVTLKAAKDFTMTNANGVTFENVTKEISDANSGTHP